MQTLIERQYRKVREKVRGGGYSDRGEAEGVQEGANGEGEHGYS